MITVTDNDGTTHTFIKPRRIGYRRFLEEIENLEQFRRKPITEDIEYEDVTHKRLEYEKDRKESPGKE